MTGPRVIDLGALADPARQPSVSLGGVVYPVKPLSVVTAQRIAASALNGNGLDAAGVMIDAGRESVPSMPADVFDALTTEQVISIVAIARGGADEVEKLIEDAKGK